MEKPVKSHFTEADLLDTYYMKPGESMPVMMHLARCEECAARYDRLDRKIREAAACHVDKPESFWAHQRDAIMESLARRPRKSALVSAAAAAVLVTFIAGATVLFKEQPPAPKPQPVAVHAQAPVAVAVNVPISSDPWDSEPLQEFASVVDWENWETPK